MKSNDALKRSIASAASTMQAKYEAIASMAEDATDRQKRAALATVNALAYQAATAGKTTAEMAKLRAEAQGIGGAVDSYVEKIAAASAHTHEFSLKTAGAQRELLVLGHELSQGSYKQFAGSLLVLAQRTGAMGLIFNKTALSIGAAAGVIALTAETALHAREQLAEYGDTISKLSQQTGISTDAVQRWAFAASTAGIEAKESAKALASLAEAQNKATHGNADAAAAFKAVGVSLVDLKSASPEELLTRVADAFHNSADGASKAAVANELFGAAGEQLIPLLDRGRAGLDELRKVADETGAVIGGKTVAQLAAMREQMEQSTAKMDAMMRTAKLQLLPTIINLTDALGDNVALKPLLEDFYKGIGLIMKSAATLIGTVVVGFEQLSEAIATSLSVVSLGAQGEFKLAANAARIGFENMKRDGDGYAQYMRKLWSDTAPPAHAHGATGAKPLDFAKGGNGAKKGDESGLNAALQEQKNSIAELDARRRESLSQAKADFDTGALTYRQYYDKLRQINEQYYREELVIAEKRVDLASQKRDIAARQHALGEMQKIGEAWTKSEQDVTNALLREEDKRAKAKQKYADQQAALVQKQAAGYEHQDASRFMSPSEQQADAERLKLKESYLSESAKLKEQYDSAQLDMAEYAQRLQIAADAYAQQEAQLEAHLQKQQQIRESYGEQAKLAVGKVVGDGKTGAQAMGEAFTTTWQQASSALDKFVTTGKFSFQDFTASLLQDMAKILLHMAEMQALKAAMSAFGFSTGGEVGHHATGGHITGPGTGTSDSIPAMLSNGEFVINAAATSKYRPLLESINSGHAAHFATGGYVGSGDSSNGGNSNGGVNVTVHNNGGQGLSTQDAKQLHALVQAFVDKRMGQNMRGQGGYAYQMRYGQI
ncbi:hypothetical protein BKK81_05375 [Cupriavidus sp. USMAHM13]|uniref:phage tail tape measure C-terminal domain-containing protein n=1 Tax=Cupriavidus sp. USMAHM13 TaxID=1389192 RepID=UPI0008A66BF9|nr:phage tail tape measure C-terminal domain-containing protein [Cupriavidus sp. USMAHM13]AOY98774.1 hypothetical protein BKK81_05375 [Cupriavidus sp. USMAHM13]